MSIFTNVLSSSSYLFSEVHQPLVQKNAHKTILWYLHTSQLLMMFSGLQASTFFFYRNRTTVIMVKHLNFRFIPLDSPKVRIFSLGGFLNYNLAFKLFFLFGFFGVLASSSQSGLSVHVHAGGFYSCGSYHLQSETSQGLFLLLKD